jgi:hypothetical protein
LNNEGRPEKNLTADEQMDARLRRKLRRGKQIAGQK